MPDFGMFPEYYFGSEKRSKNNIFPTTFSDINREYLSSVYNPSANKKWLDWFNQFKIPNQNRWVNPSSSFETTLQEAWKSRAGKPGTAMYAARQGGL